MWVRVRGVGARPARPSAAGSRHWSMMLARGRSEARGVIYLGGTWTLPPALASRGLSVRAGRASFDSGRRRRRRRRGIDGGVYGRFAVQTRTVCSGGDGDGGRALHGDPHWCRSRPGHHDQVGHRLLRHWWCRAISAGTGGLLALRLDKAPLREGEACGTFGVGGNEDCRRRRVCWWRGRPGACARVRCLNRRMPQLRSSAEWHWRRCAASRSRHAPPHWRRDTRDNDLVLLHTLLCPPRLLLRWCQRRRCVIRGRTQGRTSNAHFHGVSEEAAILFLHFGRLRSTRVRLHDICCAHRCCGPSHAVHLHGKRPRNRQILR